MSDIRMAKLSLVDGQRRPAPPEIGQVAARRGTLYILVEVSAPEAAWDHASRQIVAKAISTFSASKMGETSALQNTAEAINSFLLARNKDIPKAEHVWAGFNAAFIREDDLYLAQAGPALTYIARGNSITRFPKSFSDLQSNRGEALTPLGERPGVRARLAHFKLQQGDMLTLAASHLPTLGGENMIAQAVRLDDPEEVLESLHRMARNNDFSALVLHVAPPGAASSPAAAQADEWEEEDEFGEEPADQWEEAELDDEPEEDAWDEAPAPSRSVPTIPEPRARQEPPAAAASPPEEKPAPTPRPVRRVQSQAKAAAPPVTPQPARAVEQQPASRASSVTPKSVEPTKPVEPPKTPRTPGRATAIPSARSAAPRKGEVITGSARMIDNQGREPEKAPARNNAVLPLRDSFEPSAGGSGGAAGAQIAMRRVAASLTAVGVALLAALTRTIDWIQRGLKPRMAAAAPVLDRFAIRLWRALYHLWVGFLAVLRQVLPGDRPAPPPRDDVIPEPPGDGSAFMRTVAIAIPLILLVVAIFVWSTRGEPVAGTEDAGGDSSYAALVGQAQELIVQANNVDEATAQTLLQRANDLLNQAEPLEAAEGTPGQVAALRQQASQLGSQADTIARSPLTTLATLPEGSQPRLLVQARGTLFALEQSRAAVYRVLFDPTTVPSLMETLPLLSAQQRLAEGVLAGTPQHIVRMPPGGSRPGESLLVITTEGQLFDFDIESGVLRQISFARVTGEVQAADGYAGNLYLLDSANGQIWKYVPNGVGEYQEAPEDWLTETGRSQLGAPVDMAIDGYIYLLDSSGEVNRFQVGELKAGFALDPVVPPLTQPVAVAKVPPEATDMFVADSQRVLRFDPEGRFLVEYLPPLGSDWGTIRDIAVDDANETLYVLSNTGVYAMDIRNTRVAPSSPAPDAPASDAPAPAEPPQ